MKIAARKITKNLLDAQEYVRIFKSANHYIVSINNLEVGFYPLTSKGLAEARKHFDSVPSK